MSEREPSTNQVEYLLQQGITAAKQGAHDKARRIFMDVATLAPRNEKVWLWLAFISQNAAERMEFVTRAMTINPQSEQAREALRWARQQQNSDSPASFLKQNQNTERKTRVSHTASGTEVPRPTRSPQTHSAVRHSYHHPKRKVFTQRGVFNITIVMIVLLISAVVVYSGVNAWSRFASSESTATPKDVEQVEILQSKVLRAWDSANWQQAILLLRRIRDLVPEDEETQKRLTEAYLFRGMEYAVQDNYPLAYDYFDAALEIDPEHTETQYEKWKVQSYDTALQAFQQANWNEVISLLQPIYKSHPTYKHVRHYLYFAHYYKGKLAEEEGDWLGGLNEYEAALNIAEWKEARADYDRLYRIVYPPRKWVEVDVSEQRMRVYEDDTLLYDWVCSTGEPGRPTRYGHFEVQSKLESAYSGVWRLTMPWWLGIYWAGGSENGIHALPIRDSDGGTMWAGLLGQRVSYGCIILDNWEAKTLWEWAEIGTEVIVKQ